MYCMYCGQKIGAEARFCPMCGRRQERPADAAQAQASVASGTAKVPEASAAERTPSASRGQAPSRRSAAGGVVRPAPAEVRQDARRPEGPIASPAQAAEAPAVAASSASPTRDLSSGRHQAPRPSAAAAPEPDSSAAPAATQAMPRPVAGAYVPAAVPGHGLSAASAGYSRPAFARRDADVRGPASASPRGPVVAAVVLAAFAVLAAGAFAFGRLGSLSSPVSDGEIAQTRSQGGASTTVSADNSRAEPDSSAPEAGAQKEIELEGLTISGDAIVYVNPTFGYTVTLPSSFKAVAASDGGEGASFEDDGSGIRVDVSAGRNDSGATVESVLSEYTSAYDVSYQASGSSWLVASWEDGAGDYYAKQYVGANYVTRIQYSTPAASHETGSELIEETINDFKPGAL